MGGRLPDRFSDNITCFTAMITPRALIAQGLFQEGQPLKLHLGCGEQHFDGYVNIDYPPSEHTVMTVKADLFADLKDLDFPAESVDEIRLHHVFEHFNRVTALAKLIRWHTWLKIGGKLHIETPDLEGSARTLLSDATLKVKMGVVRHLAGDQAAAWAYHIDHWFPQRFEHTLPVLGFERVAIRSWSWPHEPYLSNVEAVAYKARNVAFEDQLTSAEALLWESTVAPSEKSTHTVWMNQLRAAFSGYIAMPGLDTRKAGKETNAVSKNDNIEPCLVNEWIREGDLVFDVGANLGTKCDIYLEKGARIVCFEPQPECARLLHEKYLGNGRVSIEERGLADKPGTMLLSICTAAHTISTFSEQWKTGRFTEYAWDKDVSVAVSTLDEMIERYGRPRYCKIDVEGFEPEVISGLSSRIPYLSFEFTIEFLKNARKCVAHLERIGHRYFNLALAERPELVFQHWVSAEDLFHYIEHTDDKLLWGDIFACSDSIVGISPQDSVVHAQKTGMAAISGAQSILSLNASQLPLIEIHDFNQRSRDKWVLSKAATCPPGSRVLDIGAGTCPYRLLFSHCDYVTHDFKKYTGNEKLYGSRDYGKIDIVSEITALPVADASFDIILCTEVLEHVPEPAAAIAEIARILRPGGRMFLTAPLGAGLHQLPYHYYGGYTPEWYRFFLPRYGLEVKEITPNGGFFKLLAQESARVAWTLPEHQHLHGENVEIIRSLFGEWIPRYLFALDDRHFIDKFTVGYHVEAVKTGNAAMDKPVKREDRPTIAGLVFSKDRALQLRATLESFLLHCQDAEGIRLHVLFKCSSPVHARQYETLKRTYPEIVFLEQTDFRSQTLEIVKGGAYILFLVDDNIFVRDFSIKDAVEAVTAEDQAIGFSLRLGRNTTYCYPLDRSQHLPDFSTLASGMLRYEWSGTECDFGYPLEVSSSLYRAAEIATYIQILSFENPNTLEAAMAEQAHAFGKRYLLCFEKSVTFCNPVNIVQNVCVNRTEQGCNYSPEVLAEYFEQGSWINVQRYAGFVPNAAHQGVDLFLDQPGISNVERPLFSIIMANYNGGQYIAEAIRSVQDQMFKDWELIIIEDCSTDNSLSIIEPFLTDRRIRLIKQPHNQGYIAALKTGIAQVRSEFFGTLDSDDMLLHNAVQVMYEAHTAYPEAGYIYSQFASCDENMHPYQIGYCDVIPPGRTNLDADKVSHFRTFKLTHYLRSSQYDEAIFCAEDKDISYKMEEVSPLKFIDKVLYLYRVLPGSQSHNQPKAAMGMRNWHIAKVNAVKRRDRHSAQVQNESLGHYELAHAAFRKGDFQEAELEIAHYQRTIRYELFPRVDNRRVINPAVSVILSADGGIKEVLETLKRLEQQTFSNFEVIIIDNGSVEAVMETMLTLSLLYIKSPITYTRAESMNIGAMYANGAIVLCMNEATRLDKGYIENIIKAFEQYEIYALRGKFWPYEPSSGHIGEAYYDLGGEPLSSAIFMDVGSAYLKRILTSMQGMNPLLDSMYGFEFAYRLTLTYGDNYTLYWPGALAYWGASKDQEQGYHDQKRYLNHKYPAIFTYYDEDTGISQQSHAMPRAMNCAQSSQYPLQAICAPDINKRGASEESAYCDQRIRFEQSAAWTDQAETLHAQGDLDGACAAIDKAITYEPLYARAFNDRGVVYWETGDNGKALENFKKAMALDPDDRDTVLNLAELLIKLERQAEAEKILKTFLGNHPDCATIHDLLVNIEVPETRDHFIKLKINSPMVSVIVPTYNRPEMLKETIKSILAQSYQDYEIVVVNDCGQDVESILSGLNREDGKIVYIKHTQNRGLAAARNTGIMASRGKYIAYLDDDDVFYPDHLETLVGCLEQNAYQVAYTDAYRAHQVYQDGSYKITGRDIPYSIDFLKDILLSQNISPVNCFMHTKQCLHEVGLFDEDFHAHEDWELWVRISRKYDFIHIKKVTTEFRWRMDGSTMSSNNRREFLRTMEEIFKRYQSDAQGKDEVIQRQTNNLMHLKSLVAQQERTQKCSIIIPVFNKLEFTKQCLEALIENTPSELYEVILVDNASTDGTQEFLACLEGDVTVITNETNLGFAKACNQGAKAATGEYLVFLNNDTVPHENWLFELIDVADAWEDVGIVGSKLLFPDNTIQHAGVAMLPVLSHLYRQNLSTFLPANKPRDLNVVTAACMLIRKDLFFAVGCFHEGYVNGCEDIDLCLSVRMAGKRVFYNPRSVLTHFEGQTPGREARMDENRKLLFDRWRKRMPSDYEKYLSDDGFRKSLTDQTNWEYHDDLCKRIVSIIIVTYNSLPDIGQCLSSIQAQTNLPYEVIIIDNNSTDGTKDYLKGIKGFQVIINDENFGFSKACNQGIQTAKGEYIVLLNPDTAVTTDWAWRMMLHFRNGVGAVGPVSNYVAGLQKYELYRKTDLWKADNNEISNNFYTWNKNRSVETKLLVGFCMMIKRSVMDDIGLLDEDFFLGIEDLEYSWRLRQKGYKLAVATDVFIFHQGQKSFSTVLPEKNRRITQECQDKLYTKLEAYYGKGQVPSTQELWGMDWFRPSQITKSTLTSIIILCFNQIEYTRRCIQSIEEYTSVPYELILVDNGSTDVTQAFLEEYAKKHTECNIILNKDNRGFAGGNNQGIAAARGDYILLLNNDVIVTQDWLERLIAHVESDANIGMAGPVSNWVSGPQLVEHVPYGRDLIKMQQFAQDYSKKNVGRIQDVLRLVGFCLLIKRHVLDIIGGLDENYGNGNYEDDDFCLHSHIAGFRNIIAHDVFIHHYGSMTFKGNSINYQATMNDNHQYFADKWKDIIEISRNGYSVNITREQQLKKLLEWGETRFSQGDVHAAIKIFKRILLFDRTNSEALNNLGVIQWQLGDPVSAMVTFQLVLSFNPKNPDALANLLQAATETGRFDLIKPTLLDILKQEQPTNPDIDKLIKAQQGNT